MRPSDEEVREVLGFFVGEDTTVSVRRKPTMFRWIRARRPAMVAGLVEALLVLAIAFGADLDAGQVAALASVAAVVFGFVVQEVVVPTAKVADVISDPAKGTVGAVAEIVSEPGPITKVLRGVAGLFRKGDG